MNTVHPKYAKQKMALRFRLLGMAAMDKTWYLALEALEYADLKHAGQLRKDGVTPYIVHPIEATLYTMTLPTLIDPLGAVVAMLNHDVLEDTNTRYQDLADELGTAAADNVAALSKKVDGVKKGDDEYWRGMYSSNVASIGKPVDRINNQHTMGAVFSLEKQISTMAVTEQRIFPLMKAGRRKFPQQELAFENAKLVLSTQLSLHRAVLRAQGQLADN